MPCRSPEVEKHTEFEIIRCFELALYQCRERRRKKKKRWLSLWSWSYTSLVKTKWRSCSLKNSAHLMNSSLPSSTLSFTPRFCTFHDKKKRKEADSIFIYKSCQFFPVNNITPHLPKHQDWRLTIIYRSGDMEYPFIAITLRSILRSSTC